MHGFSQVTCREWADATVIPTDQAYDHLSNIFLLATNEIKKKGVQFPFECAAHWKTMLIIKPQGKEHADTKNNNGMSVDLHQ